MSETSIDTYESPLSTEKQKSFSPDLARKPEVSTQRLPSLFQRADFLESADTLESMSGVSKEELMALIHRESNGDPRAKHGNNVITSRGLMQIIDKYVYGNMMIQNGR